jgi:hypothetical protein
MAAAEQQIAEHRRRSHVGSVRAGGLMLNYLRITKRGVGVILNFKHPKPGWERIIL